MEKITFIASYSTKQVYIGEKQYINILYNKEHFHILSKEEYIDIVIKQLELLNPKIVIHRITSDPDVSTLVEPTWLIKKFCLLNDIDKEMVKRDTYQGKYY